MDGHSRWINQRSKRKPWQTGKQQNTLLEINQSNLWPSPSGYTMVEKFKEVLKFLGYWFRRAEPCLFIRKEGKAN
jgi:hypothetical protein